MTTPDGAAALADNDIAALRRSLGLARLGYRDLAARRELEQVLQRWPLLAELAAPARDSAEQTP